MTGLLKCLKLMLPDRRHKKSFLNIQTVMDEGLKLVLQNSLILIGSDRSVLSMKIISASLIKPLGHSLKNCL